MLVIKNKNIAIHASENAQECIIEDLKRGTRWKLEQENIFWGDELGGHPGFKDDWRERISPLHPVRAELTADDTITLFYRGVPDISIEYKLRLIDDGVELRMPPAPLPVKACSFPGSFVPVGEKKKLIMPVMQGVLWDGEGREMDCWLFTSHSDFNMQMYGILGETGGFLFALETDADRFWRYTKQKDGNFFVENVQVSSLGEMRYERVAKIHLTDPKITPLAKRYRRHVQERGRFITWEEKLQDRPQLENIFGALMCFVGYLREDGMDYYKECCKLKNYGFDRALVYPVHFTDDNVDRIVSDSKLMFLSPDEIQNIRSLGYMVSPWTYMSDVLDDGTPESRRKMRVNERGEISSWFSLGTNRWSSSCPPVMLERAKAATEELKLMDWEHFDVLACLANEECYALDHPGHLGRQLTRADEMNFKRQVFNEVKKRGMLVSSEGFNDFYSLEYDAGSVKMFPSNAGRPFQTIPLTSLVYHDSILNTWWEVHNYNNPFVPGGWSQNFYFEYCGGRTRLMAAWDALSGGMPDVFPFGKQFAWTGHGNGTRNFSFRFEDPMVQFALQEAKPVADLHRKIGKLEMVDFELLSNDGCLQKTTFADGTNVIANFSSAVHCEYEPKNSIPPESWFAWQE